jgi:hypothetical protein
MYAPWTKFSVAIVLILAGCGGYSSEVRNGQTANAFARVPDDPSQNPCFRRVGNVWHHVGEGNCVELLPPQRMRGVWIYDFEESSFIPNAVSIPRADNRVRFRVNLQVVPEDIARASRTQLNMRGARAFAIDIIGRRSKNSGPYYIGGDEYIVVVDRIISARYLGLAPEPDFVRALNEGREVNFNQPLPADLWNPNTPQPN